MRASRHPRPAGVYLAGDPHEKAADMPHSRSALARRAGVRIRGIGQIPVDNVGIVFALDRPFHGA